MNVARYFATDNPLNLERQRLESLRELVDPITKQRLIQLGIGRGWRCLEVAAGTGGVARWMTEQVGSQGRVVATELDTRLLVENERSNLEIRRHDILKDDLETARYDVVHCRMLLQHLVDPLPALERMQRRASTRRLALHRGVGLGVYGSADPNHPAAAEFDRSCRTIFDHLRVGRVLDPYFDAGCSNSWSNWDWQTSATRGLPGLVGRGTGRRFSQMSLAIVRGPLHRRGSAHRRGLRWVAPHVRRPIVLIRGYDPLRGLGSPHRLTRTSADRSDTSDCEGRRRAGWILGTWARCSGGAAVFRPGDRCGGSPAFRPPRCSTARAVSLQELPSCPRYVPSQAGL